MMGDLSGFAPGDLVELLQPNDAIIFGAPDKGGRATSEALRHRRVSLSSYGAVVGIDDSRESNPLLVVLLSDGPAWFSDPSRWFRVLAVGV